jgi:hypothetical protein
VINGASTHLDVDNRYLGDVLSQHRSGNKSLTLRIHRLCGTYGEVTANTGTSPFAQAFRPKTNIPFTARYKCLGDTALPSALAGCCAISPLAAPMGVNGAILAAPSSDADVVGELVASTRMWKRIDLAITLAADYQSGDSSLVGGGPPAVEVPATEFLRADGSRQFISPSIPLYVLKNASAPATGERHTVFTLSRCRAAGNPLAFCELITASDSAYPATVFTLLAIILAVNLGRHVPNAITAVRLRAPTDAAAVGQRAAALLDLLALGPLFAWRLPDAHVAAGAEVLEPPGERDISLLSRIAGTHRPENVLARRLRLPWWTLQPAARWPPAWRERATVGDFLRTLLLAPWTGAAANILYGWFFARGACVRVLAAPVLLACALAHMAALLMCTLVAFLVSIPTSLGNFIVYSSKRVAIRYVRCR